MKTKRLIPVLLLLIAVWSSAQTAQWVRYPNNLVGMVSCMAIDASDTKWVGGSTLGGLWKKSLLKSVNYTTYNSGLISNAVSAIAVKANGDVWIGSDKSYGGLPGISILSGTTWTSYSPSDCPTLTDKITCIAFDHSGNSWMGTDHSGLIKFDGTNWTTYTSSNSSLISNAISSLSVDNLNNVWVGTLYGGVAEISANATWTLYNKANSNLRNDIIHGSAADLSGNIWFATDSGVAKLSAATFTYYDSIHIVSIAVAANGIVWYSAVRNGGNAVVPLASLNSNSKTYYTTPSSYIMNTICCDSHSVPWMSSETNYTNETGIYSFCQGTAPVIASNGAPTICPGGYVVLTPTTNYASYQWSDTTMAAIDTVRYSGAYSLVATDANGCPAQSNVITLNNSPLVLTHTSRNMNCATNTHSGATETVNGGTAPYTYSWSTGSSASSVSNIPVGTSTVTVTDFHHCRSSDTVAIVLIPPVQPTVCMVSVDSLSQNNTIFWDKTVFTDVDSFIVYREISANVYKRIAAVPYAALSEFKDTVRSLYFPNTGDPNAGTYRYKIQTRDSCGNYSALSLYHNTIYIASNNLGTFGWTQPYSIENTANPVINYLLQRDDNSTGVWKTVQSVAGTQQTISDPNYQTYKGTASWRVVTQWNIQCVPTMRIGQSSSSSTVSISNTKRPAFDPAGIPALSTADFLKIYPSPNNGKFTIEVSGPESVRVEVYSLIGELVYTAELTQVKSDISLTNLSKGTYLVRVISTRQQSIQRILIQ